MSALINLLIKWRVEVLKGRGQSQEPELKKWWREDKRGEKVEVE